MSTCRNAVSTLFACFIFVLAVVNSSDASSSRPRKATAQLTPVISTIQWDPIALGGTQCASGSSFGNIAGTIVLNGTILTPSAWTDSQVCVVVPTDTAPGLAGLQIVNAVGPSNSVNFTVNTSVPTLSGVSPTSAGVGVPVTITGTNFGSSQGLSVVQLQGQSFEIVTWTDTQIVAVVPAGLSPGVYSVNVIVEGVTVSGGLTVVGAPQIASVQWEPMGVGGTQCANGTGFGSAAGSVILNGATVAPSLWSDAQACFVVPANTAAGAATLQFVNGAGPGNSIGFTVTTAVLTLTSVSPASAGAGVPVTISGSNFDATQGQSLVRLRGQNFGIVSWSDSQIVATVPAGVPPGGSYSVDVTVHGVTASGGLSLLPSPNISSVQWDPVGLGGTQCANGTGFGTTSAIVLLNGSSRTPSQWTDSQVCVVVPPGSATGAATLQVVNAGGPSNVASFVITAALPTVASVNPSSVGVGVPVTITGTNLGAVQGNSYVRLQAQNFSTQSWSDTQIVATVPGGIPPGLYSVDVTVTGVTVSGSVTIVGVPQVTSVQWDPVALGGTECASGTGFGSAPGTINFNGASLSPSVWSDTQASFTVPSSAAVGASTLQVVNGAGPGNSFTFTITAAVPTLATVTPSQAAAGSTVTIAGTNFGGSQGNSTAQIRGQPFGIVSWSDTQITATLPAGIPPGGPYSVDVTVHGVTVSGSLTILAFPHITSLSPSSGAPGASVTIAGSSFGSTSGQVKFNGTPAAILSWSDSAIVAAVPSGAFSGGVIAVTGAGLSSNAMNFTVLSGAPSLDPDIVSRIATIDTGRISTSIQTLANFGTRNTCSSNTGASPGIGAARNWLQSQFSALPGVQVTLFSFNTTACGASRTVQDVVAWIPGAGHPNRLIVIGGHYDSRTVNVTDGISSAPGANDSGSQASLVLEAAHALAGGTYDATIVFVAWAGEEQGLLGSSAFVQNFKSLFPKGIIELNLNCDIVGGDNTANDANALQQFRLFSPGTPRETSSNAMGSTDNTSPSRLIMHFVGDWGSQYVPQMAMLPNLREDRPGRGGDHESFIANSIAAVRFIDPLENTSHQHTGNDLFTFVTPSYTARVANVIAATAAALAKAPTPPQAFSATLANSNTVNVTWSAPKSGPPVDHYVVSARPVTENFYHTRVIITGAQTSAQVRINEDLAIPAGANFFISVAAVDGSGHESLFAYPEYRCTSASCVVPAGAMNVTATK